MYAKKAADLIKEYAAAEPGQLSAFNKDLFQQVVGECKEHYELHLESLIKEIEKLKDIEAVKKMNNEELEEQDKIALKSFTSGALIHHLSILRNKRCLMAYAYNRAELIRPLGWIVEGDLPQDLKEKLSEHEKEYLKNHGATLHAYMSDIHLDLSVDMVPPKDPHIKVRVLDDIGTVLLSDQTANLALHAILFIRRTDAEQYIAQGLMEELMD